MNYGQGELEALRLRTKSDGSVKRRQFELMICTQPITFAVATAVVFIAPRQALFAAAMTQVAIALASKRAARGAR